MSGFWDWLNELADGGDGDLALWLLLPGYILFDEGGRRGRFPLMYAEKDRERQQRHPARGRTEFQPPPRWLTLVVALGVIAAGLVLVVIFAAVI